MEDSKGWTLHFMQIKQELNLTAQSKFLHARISSGNFNLKFSLFSDHLFKFTLMHCTWEVFWCTIKTFMF